LAKTKQIVQRLGTDGKGIDGGRLFDLDVLQIRHKHTNADKLAVIVEIGSADARYQHLRVN